MDRDNKTRLNLAYLRRSFHTNNNRHTGKRLKVKTIQNSNVFKCVCNCKEGEGVAYFTSVDIGENGAPTAVAEAELNYRRSEQHKLRSLWPHHFCDSQYNALERKAFTDRGIRRRRRNV